MGGPGSSTLLAKIEPSGFFVSLASHIFIFLNKHMLTSEATIISNYIKNGLAEPQMIVLADMIHDLEGMISFSNLFLTKLYFSWKKYFPNPLETWLLHQIFLSYRLQILATEICRFGIQNVKLGKIWPHYIYWLQKTWL